MIALPLFAALAGGDYFALPLGWDLRGTVDLGHIGPCNASQYVPPPQVLSLCDESLACLATNYVPVQPGVTGSDTRCAWLKSMGVDGATAAFVHHRRCNGTLNATTVLSPSGGSYKFCPTVGDAFYDVIATVAASTPTTYAECMGYCDANPNCAACQTDGHNCTLLSVHSSPTCGNTSPGCDAWFKIFNHSAGSARSSSDASSTTGHLHATR